jgi:cystathionine beta-lyase/cystathionine gamma-synthase
VLQLRPRRPPTRCSIARAGRSRRRRQRSLRRHVPLFSACSSATASASASVDPTDLAAVERALEPATRYVYLETPSNPLLRSPTSPRAAAAHARGKLVVVDNTFATPFLQRPLELGADSCCTR